MQIQVKEFVDKTTLALIRLELGAAHSKYRSLGHTEQLLCLCLCLSSLFSLPHTPQVDKGKNRQKLNIPLSPYNSKNNNSIQFTHICQHIRSVLSMTEVIHFSNISAQSHTRHHQYKILFTLIASQILIVFYYPQAVFPNTLLFYPCLCTQNILTDFFISLNSYKRPFWGSCLTNHYVPPFRGSLGLLKYLKRPQKRLM